MQHRHSSQITIVVLTGCLISALANGQEENKLTPQEKADGCQLLFDGKDLSGWHSYLEKGSERTGPFRMTPFSLRKTTVIPRRMTPIW